jgi:hypothetical protein
MTAQRENCGAMHSPRMGSQPRFLIADLRRPGEPMAALPLKLPADAVLRLQAQSDRLKCSRGALGRALLLEALERLEAGATP